jgi:hypothetical protein
VSRAICEKLKIQYPTEVLGEVVDTIYSDNSIFVEFKIQSVPDDSIELPAVCLVNLEEIYPTKYQENNALNVDFTADCIERYKFFFSYIFLPFDDDSDKCWAEKYLETRVQMFYDLKNKKISKQLSSYIRQIISKAKIIQQQKEILENSLDTNNEEDDDNRADLSMKESKEIAAKLLDLHLQMNTIKNEYLILSNPEMRDVYESLKYRNISDDTKKEIYAIIKSGTINDQIQFLDSLKQRISTHDNVVWTMNFQEALSSSTKHGSEIYVSNGHHKLSFLEYLCDNLLISGVNKMALDTIDGNSKKNCAVISSSEMGPLLFAIDGNIEFNSLIIDCSNIKTGFLIKSGTVKFTNCFITSSNKSLCEAFNISGESNVILDECKISNFSTGFNINGKSKLTMKHSSIIGCDTAINALNEKVEITLDSAEIVNCSEYAIARRSKDIEEGQKKVIFDICSWNSRE